MRTKVTSWYDKKNDRPLYGIKAFFKTQWYNVAEGGIALLFETREQVEEKRKELRKLKPDSKLLHEVVPKPA